MKGFGTKGPKPSGSNFGQIHANLFLGPNKLLFFTLKNCDDMDGVSKSFFSTAGMSLEGPLNL